jgi:uncharacterized membrane protein YraQ (UPF0718 family)
MAVLDDFVRTLQVNWYYLLLAIVVAAALRTYVGTDRLQSALGGHPWITIPAAVAFATVTPFCSCGTEAVVLGMMAGSVPWAPIIAFMVASPLTSPGELLYSAGLFGWPFALFFFVGATLIGLGAGAATHFIERRGWLKGQARMRVDDLPKDSSCCTEPAPEPACCPTAATRNEGSSSVRADLDPANARAPVAALIDGQLPYEPDLAVTPPRLAERLRLALLRHNLWILARRLVVFFTAFVLLGYLIIELVPSQIFETYLGQSSNFAVPLAAALGIPFYISSDASLPLIASLVSSGMAVGPALAFLVTGAGTSVGAIAGSLVIARRRVVGLVIGFLFVGAVVLGELGRVFL